ncbi:FAD binding domain-containing protein [bacterium]|nr:FAD binding domain-containing protein [bacterium]
MKTYHRPAKLEEALRLVADENDKNVPLAGGTTLALNVRGVDGLVDMSALGLSYIRLDNRSLRLGAMTPIREIQRSEPVRQAAQGIISESAKNYLTALIRNRATIGGILAAGNFWADLATVLVALDASVTIRGAAERTISLEEFIKNGPRKSLGGGILTEVVIPPAAAGAQCGYSRLAKVETDISIVSAAVCLVLSGKTIRSARVAVGNGSRPIRLPDLEKSMAGQTLSAAADLAARKVPSISAESDIRASAEYRKEVAAVLVKRLLI